MARKTAAVSLTKLLDESSRPVYVVDAGWRIVYCNPALAAWMELEPHRIVGRLVEYHSAAGGLSEKARDAMSPLTDLCPPPRALRGEPSDGTISCIAGNGRLAHRQAHFVPIHLGVPAAAAERDSDRPAVLVLLAARDMTPQELTTELASEPASDQLHQTIRHFRRGQAAQHAAESLLGHSSAIRKVNAQVAAAAASGANVLILGPRGSGRSHVARAIHYHGGGDSPAQLIPLDCEVLSDNLLRRAIDMSHSTRDHSPGRGTLLLENLEGLSKPHQAQLLSAMRQNSLPARIIATWCMRTPNAWAEDETVPNAIDPGIVDSLSTITIRVPRLVDRIEDLPVLAQSFLESCNRGSAKQVGSVRSDALDLLALHSWPGELDELREAIAAAYRTCASHEIVPTDLPAVVHHAKQAAMRASRPQERIVLDDLLADIEKEVIARAMTTAGGNKTEAAELLGMTRPRLYRRLLQLGLVDDTALDAERESPEFVERDSTDEAP